MQIKEDGDVFMNLEDEVNKLHIKINRIETKVTDMKTDVNTAVKTIPYQSKLLQYFRIGLLSLGVLFGAAAGGCTVAAFGQDGRDASGTPFMKPTGTLKPQIVQDFPDCGRTWHKQYDGLDQEQLYWFKQISTVQYGERDLDGDGEKDDLRLTSYPSMVGVEGGCKLGQNWYEKQNILTYYHSSTGQRQVFHWTGGLTKGFDIHLENGVASYLTVNGVEYVVDKMQIKEDGGLEKVLVRRDFEKRLDLK